MIHIEQNQPLKDNANYIVAVPTGDYNETDLLECYAVGNDPLIPTCMFQAQFVAFGKEIYTQTDEITEDQVSQLLANVPADQVINNRKLIDGKRPAAKYVARIIKRKDKKENRQLRTDEVSDFKSTTTPLIERNDDFVNTKDLDVSTPEPLPQLDTTTDTLSEDVIPAVDLNLEVSTSTEVTPTATSTIPTDVDLFSTTTPIALPILENQGTTTETSSSSSEVVAFAKKYTKNQIAKKLGL